VAVVEAERVAAERERARLPSGCERAELSWQGALMVSLAGGSFHPKYAKMPNCSVACWEKEQRVRRGVKVLCAWGRCCRMLPSDPVRAAALLQRRGGAGAEGGGGGAAAAAADRRASAPELDALRRQLSGFTGMCGVAGTHTYTHARTRTRTHNKRTQPTHTRMHAHAQTCTHGIDHISPTPTRGL
jgi:hypothetical protein